jgi:DNA-binding LacI/PurR family transcriptional regulator
MKYETVSMQSSSRRQDRRRLTLRDVAAELGVSAKTVSNAYARPDQLSSELRNRILATAARLGYSGPDPLAAGLRRGQVGVVGVAYANRLSYALDDPVTRELLAGITSAVEAAGIGLLLLPGSTDPEKRAAAISGAVIDGLLASSLADDDPILQMAIARRLPLAVIDQPRPDQLDRLAPNIPWIGIADRPAAREAANHVLELGHRRLGVVCFGLRRSPVRGLVDVAVQQAATYGVSRDRLAGYRDAAERYGVDWSLVPVHQGTDSTPEEGETGAAAILAHIPRPTALLCLSDRLAEGALRAARKSGLRVPEDLSIVGFDDAIPTAATLNLTTVLQPSRSKGEKAAQALFAVLQASELLPSSEPLPTQLIVRRSTSAPPD